jgi:hypothetical protein
MQQHCDANMMESFCENYESPFYGGIQNRKPHGRSKQGIGIAIMSVNCKLFMVCLCQAW